MILLDQPYISDFLKKTIRDFHLKAIDTGKVISHGDLNLLTDQEAIQYFRTANQPFLYSTSENAIDWVCRNLGFTHYPEKINLFKDKVEFREMTRDLFPDFFFREARLENLNALDFDNLPHPFIIKPAIGFFSLGVYKVISAEDFSGVKKKIQQEQSRIIGLYPEKVLDTSRYIIEECIEGDEFAIDTCIDDEGIPVIYGIMKHVFGSETDVSDRVYLTSRQIVRENLTKFDSFLKEIANRAGLRNFPMHIEIREDCNGKLMPVEINALRFGAWCTSAELTHHAFGYNEYATLLSRNKPDWEKILDQADDHYYCLVIFDNSTGFKPEEIAAFDYEKAISCFSNPLELRKVDVNKFPLFGFLYMKVEKDQFHEIEFILKSDLTEFVTTK